VSQSQILVGDMDNVRALAAILAKGVNCLNSGDPNQPCGKCQSCKVFDSGNHPDTFYVTKTERASIGVDDVREQIIAPMSTKPFSYKHKVFIIDKADTLTDAAQSALLKTIEEPAPYGFFLFLAPSEHSFLPTILSRSFLRKVGGQQSVSMDTKMQQFANNLADTIHNLDTYSAFAMYKKFDEYKENKETLQQLLDAIYLAYGHKISSASPGQIPEAWLNAASVISRTKQVISQNGNTQLAIELMLAKLSK